MHVEKLETSDFGIMKCICVVAPLKDGSILIVDLA